MDAKKLEIAVLELEKWNNYPIEYRIAKYLIKAGYSGMKDNISQLMQKVDPTMGQRHTNSVWNIMRDIESITNEKQKYHINNIPDLL
jgi:hypothetical protein